MTTNAIDGLHQISSGLTEQIGVFSNHALNGTEAILIHKGEAEMGIEAIRQMYQEAYAILENLRAQENEGGGFLDTIKGVVHTVTDIAKEVAPIAVMVAAA